MEKESCAEKKRVMTKKELPLCCPLPNETLWNGHPRVYLDVEETGHVVCPYCGTQYRLME